MPLVAGGVLLGIILDALFFPGDEMAGEETVVGGGGMNGEGIRGD